MSNDDAWIRRWFNQVAHRENTFTGSISNKEFATLDLSSRARKNRYYAIRSTVVLSI